MASRKERAEGERQRIVGARRFWANKDQDQRQDSVWSSIYCTIRERRRCKSSSSLPRAASWGSRTPSTVSSEDAVSDCTTPSTSASARAGAARTPKTMTATATATVGGLGRRPSRSKSMGELPPCKHESIDPDLDPDPDLEVKEEALVAARRYQTTCYLAMKPVPVRFSSSVSIRIGSTRKTFTEQVDFKTRLVPLRFSETLCLPQTFASSSTSVVFPNLRLRNGNATSRERFV